MAAASDLDNGGISTLQAEEVPPPDEQQNVAAAAPVPWPAAVAERYERREKLGEGFFGDVYKAWDRVDERFVAVKRLDGRIGDGFVETGIPDFARQAKSLSACRGHPSIVELLATYAADSEDGDCFTVMEYAGPMNLRQYMDDRRRNGQPFEEDEVREIMGQLLAGVKHAHGAGVLHREVVPENVIVNQDDAVNDGKRVYNICGFNMSEPATQAGSPSPYRAPELFLGSKDYDGRVDTWALGCIMAELI